MLVFIHFVVAGGVPTTTKGPFVSLIGRRRISLDVAVVPPVRYGAAGARLVRLGAATYSAWVGWYRARVVCTNAILLLFFFLFLRVNALFYLSI